LKRKKKIKNFENVKNKKKSNFYFSNKLFWKFFEKQNNNVNNNLN